MFTKVESSQQFSVTSSVLGSGNNSPDETSFVVYDTANGGVTSVSKSFDTPEQVEVHSLIDINRANPTSDNSSNTLAFIDAYDSNDTILNVINYDILNNSHSGFHQNNITEINVLLESYKTTESTSQGFGLINCESDLSTSPLDNFVSGFECQEPTGSQRLKTIYDVRYRRSKIRI